MISPASVPAKISVIMAVYNEKDSLVPVVEELRQSFTRWVSPDYELIFVDDGSVDGSAGIIDALVQKYDNTRVVRHDVNRGIGAALRSGFNAARNDYLISVPADGQMNPHDIRRYYEAMADADFVSSYRIHLKTHPWDRRLLSFGWRVFMFVLFGPLPRLEAQRMFHRKILDQADITCDTGMGNMELMIKAFKAGYTFKEIGVETRSRHSGRSKVKNVSRIWKHMKETAGVRFSPGYRRFIKELKHDQKNTVSIQDPR